MGQQTDIRWIQRYDEGEVLPIVRLIYSDYAPLLKQLDESLEVLSQRQEYQQA